MEIRDYVSKMGRRLLILVLLPLLAGGVAFGLLAGTPQQHLAESVLTVPSSVVGGASSGSVAQYMANFEQAIVSEPIIASIADQVGVDGAEVRDSLQTTQLGNSNLIRVSYQGPNSGDAARIVELATRLTFELVAQIQLPFGQSLDVLESRVRATTSDLRVADSRLEEFLLENGLVLPREQYLLIASDVARLESEISRAQAEGISTTALVAALRDRQRELAELGAILPKYERLHATVDRAEDDLDAAQDELRLAENQLAHLTPQMTDVTTELIPRTRTIGKAVGVAAGGGFIVAIALMFLFPSRTAFPSGMVRNAWGFPSRP
jgi:hypothetical protein